VIYRGERDLADQVADGRLTVEDADAVRTFAAFLRESADSHGDAAARQAWRERWHGYITGTDDGPAGDRLGTANQHDQSGASGQSGDSPAGHGVPSDSSG
jgi:hypothetical protein